MLTYLRDVLTSARLRARYRRLVNEQLLSLAESTSSQPLSEAPSRWSLLGQHMPLTDTARTDLRNQVRQLVTDNPHAKNLLRLLEIYVVGPGLKLTHSATAACNVALQPPSPPRGGRGQGEGGVQTAFIASSPPASSHPFAPLQAPSHPDPFATADALWQSFLTHNHRHYSFREHARRAWRDGESFLRLFPSPTWPPTLRFLDPEHIGPTADQPDSQGILTDPLDVESPHTYFRINPQSGDLLERLPAEHILHTRLGVDSNQKRGLSLFAPILDTLAHFDRWLDTELTARRLQASIVLWRKVQGSPAQATAFAEALQSNTPSHASAPSRERVRPGTILTTSHGTDLQYLQPDTNFGDAVPLGRLLLLSVAAGGGVPEFMLTSDASNANFASTMVAEGPAVKLFQAEQQFFAGEFRLLWRWVMSEAIRLGYLSPDFFDQVQPDFTFPQLVNRDRTRERLADARLIEAGVLSRAEVARRDGVDPIVMRTELQSESTP
jgi:hypothetical protein